MMNNDNINNNMNYGNGVHNSQFISFPQPEVAGRRLSEITNAMAQPPSYEASLASSSFDIPSNSICTPSISIRNSYNQNPPAPPVPPRPNQRASTSQINSVYTQSVYERNTQPLNINKKDKKKLPITPSTPSFPTTSPTILNNSNNNFSDQCLSPASLNGYKKPHSRSSSIYSMDSRIEPFYGNHSLDDDHDDHHNKLTIEEQEEQDLAQAIELSKIDTHHPFSFDDNETESSLTFSSRPNSSSVNTVQTPDTTPNPSIYNQSEGHYSFVNTSEITYDQNESTFVKKERMRQHVEQSNLKKWQLDFDDVTSEWHNLVNPETLSAFDKNEIARQSALFEFMRTEKMYFNDLYFLEQVFVPPLRDSDIIPIERRQSFLKDAVFNLSNLVANHKRGLMRCFERQNIEHPLIESIADMVLVACINWQDDYAAYIAHWPIQEATLKNELIYNKKFSQHCEKCSRHPKAQRQSIIALLQRPVFRLPRYPLILNRMLDNTPENHSDRENLPIASRAISDIAKSTQPGIEQSKNKVLFWEMASALDFRTGELHDIDLLDDMRTLLHDGLLYKRERSPTDLHGWHGKRIFVLDNYLLITEPNQKKSSDQIRYRLTSRPLPLELLVVSNDNPSPTHRTACLLSNERRSDGSRILFTQLEPERIVHGLSIKHIGNGKEYKLFASTSQERDDWKIKINEAIGIRKTFIEANKLLTLTTLTSRSFRQSVLAETDKYEKASPNRINSASSFKWSNKNFIALATPSGVYIGYEDKVDSYQRVIGLRGIESVIVLSQFSLLIILCECQLYGYDLEELCPSSSKGPKRKFGRIRLSSSSEKVTYFKVGSTVGKGAIITYVSNRVFQKSVVQFYEPLNVNVRIQAYEDKARVKKPKREVWMREALPSINLATSGNAQILFPFPSSRHVAIIEENTLRVLDPTNQNRVLTLPKFRISKQVFDNREQAKHYQINIHNINDIINSGKVKPIELFTTKSGEYVLIYDEFGLYINEKGIPLKNANIIKWNHNIISATIDGNHLILFSSNFIEIRNKFNGMLLQILNQNKDLRLISQNCLKDEPILCVERFARSHGEPYGIFDHAFKLNTN